MFALSVEIVAVGGFVQGNKYYVKQDKMLWGRNGCLCCSPVLGTQVGSRRRVMVAPHGPRNVDL